MSRHLIWLAIATSPLPIGLAGYAMTRPAPSVLTRPLDANAPAIVEATAVAALHAHLGRPADLVVEKVRAAAEERTACGFYRLSPSQPLTTFVAQAAAEGGWTIATEDNQGSAALETAWTAAGCPNPEPVNFQGEHHE